MGGFGTVNGVKYVEFDNFYICKIQHNGLIWNSSEQLYQALKFKDKKYQKKISEEQHVMKAWELGQSREHELVDNFEEQKANLMYYANFEKFRQNPHLANVLTSTEGKIVFTKSCDFWNRMNSKILMKIRDKLSLKHIHYNK